MQLATITRTLTTTNNNENNNEEEVTGRRPEFYGFLSYNKSPLLVSIGKKSFIKFNLSRMIIISFYKEVIQRIDYETIPLGFYRKNHRSETHLFEDDFCEWVNRGTQLLFLETKASYRRSP